MDLIKLLTKALLTRNKNKTNHQKIIMTKERKDKPIATMTTAMTGETPSSTTVIQVTTSNATSTTPIALPTRMVLSACAGMGAAIFCHPLGK